MSNAAKLKKKAVELEQKKQFDKALALYVQFLQESDGALDDVDVPLYNRVGDLMLRVGNTSEALNYYEKAVDLYADRGFLNNAIALCNKVLRQSPGRSSIYYKLGKISATKGFKSDAKKNFLEYADRMQKGGQINEAFRALKEFADLCPDQDDIRLLLAEQLTKENRQDEALEQLQKLHDKLESEGRGAEARATVDRMKAIDPNVVPRTSGSYVAQKSSDLIFLDITYDESGAPQRKTPQQPSGHPTTDPDLVVLTLTDPGVRGATPDLAISGGLEVPAPLDLDDDEPPALLDASEFDAPADVGIELLAVDDTPSSTELLDAALLEHDVPGDRPGPQGPGLVGAASDLSDDFSANLDTAPSDLFNLRTPPRADESLDAGPQPGLDPDVSFPSLDFGDTMLPSADEVTSGGFAAVMEPASPGADDNMFPASQLESDAANAETAEAPREPLFQVDVGTLLEEAAAGASESDDPFAGDGELNMTWPDADAPTPASGAIAVVTADAGGAEAEVSTSGEGAELEPKAGDGGTSVESALALGDSVIDVELEIESSHEPMRGAAGAMASEFDAVADLATPGRREARAEVDASENEPAELAPTTTTGATPEERAPVAAPVGAGAAELEEDPTTSPLDALRETIRHSPDDWQLRRRYAEALLESGDRLGGTRELEAVMMELERRGHLESAHTVVEELIRLSPDSVRHHQKRVELAVRSSDRPGLIEAYIDLGDALFRSGEEEKARAVYQRVLELAPEDARARAAMLSIGVQVAPPPPRQVAAEAPRLEARQGAAERRAPTNGAIGGEAPRADQPARGGALAARSAAASNDFVNLGEWLREDDGPRSTRMVTEEKAPSGDEQADFQEMLKKFKQGIAENVDAEDYESHYDLGVAYKEMGLTDEAVAEFQKALRGSTHRIRSYEALGQCFVEKEQFHVASTVLSRALGSANGDADDHQLVGVLYLLGRASEALNKHADALDYYHRVVAVEIEFRDVAERIRTIERKAP